MTSYVGATPLDTYSSLQSQHFTTSATTSYVLSQAVTNENDIRLYINNVSQQPGSSYAYTCSGTTLTLSSPTSATDTMYCVFVGKSIGTIAPPDGSVSDATITGMAASKLTGTIADARFPATLPASSGANLTALTAGNITGVVPPANLGTGTANATTFLNGSGAYSEPSGGAWGVKSSGTATATTAWEVTGLSKTTKCILTDFRTPSNSSLKLKMSSNNGTSYDSGSSDYSYAILHHNDTNTTSYFQQDANNDFIVMMNQGTSGNGTMRNYLEMTIYDPYIATGHCLVEFHCSCYDNANWMFRQPGLGRRKSNDAINAIQLTTGASSMTFNYVVLELN